MTKEQMERDRKIMEEINKNASPEFIEKCDNLFKAPVIMVRLALKPKDTKLGEDDVLIQDR